MLPLIIVESKRRKHENLQRAYPNAAIIDVTSKGEIPWLKFSPFYPHGQIPVPFSPGIYAVSVEGIWQGLKVFEQSNIDTSKFSVTDMQGIKRSTHANGPILGHRAGVTGKALLSYREARYLIYLPSYKWVLDHKLQTELNALRQLAIAQTVILLDYETNSDVENLTLPLSHAALIVKYLNGEWPKSPFSDMK